MSTLAQQLNYDREVIRVWYEFILFDELVLKIYILRFCNKRQALKNSAKKFKTNQINDDNESTTSSLIDNKLIDTTNYSKDE
jgi:hypothetical protein